MTGAGNGARVDRQGVAAAWQFRQAAIAGAAPQWTVSADVVAGTGVPTAMALLQPETNPAHAALAEWLETCIPHVLRPVRMVARHQPKGFFGRLLGGGAPAGEIIDLADHAAGRALGEPTGSALLTREFMVDVPRLTIALARDGVARGGSVSRAAADTGDLAVTAPTADDNVARVVLRRPWRDLFGYRWPMGDGATLTALPFDADHLLLEGPPGARALQQAASSLFANWPDRAGTLASAPAATTADGLGDLPAVAGTGLAADPGLQQGTMEGGYGMFANRLAATFAHLDGALIRGLVARHGATAPQVLKDVRAEADLGQDFGAGLFAAEVRWFATQEWAHTADDILDRRGDFRLRGADAVALQRWMARGPERGLDRGEAAV